MSLLGTAIATVIFSVLFLLERFFPLRSSSRPLLQRLMSNAGMVTLAFAVNATVVQLAFQTTQQWTADRGIGLMYLLPLPTALQFILAFLLMDLTFYYWHRANHAFRFLWRFHNAHHIDPDLDISTAFRFHFGEMLLSAGFRAFQVVLIGVSIPAYLVYETAYQANTLFHHSNVRLPLWLERRLNWVLVTPRMHGIHHSQIQQETNSNWSIVFSWWDRLNGTLRLNIPQSALKIGVPAYTKPEDNQFWKILRMPFQPQRDYWSGADQSEMRRESTIWGDHPTQMVDSAGEAVPLNSGNLDVLS